MKPPEFYVGREQTYLKHFFLERYLERVAYSIGSFADEFVYVDGFSGPWQSADEAFEDTSFGIAIKKLRQVREGLAAIRRHPRFRCLFIEKDAAAFRSLEHAVAAVRDIEVQALNGEFETLIPHIQEFVRRSFALVFIDPTGWTGFGLRRIQPILRLRCEILINFMFDHVNRFLDDPRPETTASFDELFGGPGWQAAVKAGTRREDAIVDLYRERVRALGGFSHTTCTRILKPTANRAYFYLVYATRHPKGILEFRSVEQKSVGEQERVRLAAKQAARVERTGQAELFGASGTTGPPSFEEERAARIESALSLLRSLLQRKGRVPYEDARVQMLELPFVWEQDVKRLILELRASGALEVEGLKRRERTPKEGHMLVSTGSAAPPGNA